MDERKGVVRRCTTAVALMLALGGAAPTIAAADPALGLADDGGLVTQPVDPDAVLAFGSAHGATFVRLIAYMGSYPNDDRYVDAARRAAAAGFGLDVVLALPWGQAQAGVAPPAFAAWAAGLAARMAAIGPPLRVSVLNEPDLYLSASDDCDASTALRVVREAGYAPVWTRTRVTLRRSRIARRVVRRHGHRRMIRRKLVWTVHRWRTRTVLRAADTAIHVATISVARGCLSVQRARRAATFLGAAIPAVRAAAPGIEVGAGETSPLAGVEVFMRELARVGIPSVDRWAHHPYPVISDGRQVASAAGQSGSDQLVAYARLVHALFGAATPIDLTEFGVLHSLVPDPQVRASIWRTAFADACAARARSIVAYQWTPTPAGQGRSWDTSIVGAGEADTPESAQLPSLRC